MLTAWEILREYLVSALTSLSLLGVFVVLVPQCQHRVSHSEVIGRRCFWWGWNPDVEWVPIPSSQWSPALWRFFVSLGVIYASMRFGVGLEVDSTFVPRTPGTGYVLISVKEGVALALVWTWGTPALLAAWTSSVIRWILVGQFQDIGATSALACSIGLFAATTLHVGCRYYWESQFELIAKHTRQPKFLHPFQRFPTWILAAFAAMGGCVIAIWIACTAFWIAHQFRPTPFGADWLFRLTTRIMPAYVLNNTLAFTVIVSVLLPREGEGDFRATFAKVLRRFSSKSSS